MDWLVEVTLTTLEKRWRQEPDDNVSWIERVSGKDVILHLKGGGNIEATARVEPDRQMFVLSFQGASIDIPI